MIDPRIIDEAYEELNTQALNESGNAEPMVANTPVEEKRDPKIERIKKLVNDISSLLYKLEDNPYDAEFGKEDDDLRDEMKKAASKTIVKMVDRLKDIVEDDIEKKSKKKDDDDEDEDSDDDTKDEKKNKKDDDREGKFEIYKDKAGKFRFRLKAKNGEIIMSSEAYESKQALQKAIASVIENANDSDADDTTEKKEDKKDDEDEDNEKEGDEEKQEEENQMLKLFPTESVKSPQGKEYIILEVNETKSLVRDASIGETFKVDNDILKKWKNS